MSVNGKASGDNARSAAQRLRAELAPYTPGNCPVRVVYRTREAVCELVLGDASRVRLEDELLNALGDWLDSDNVRIDYQ